MPPTRLPPLPKAWITHFPRRYLPLSPERAIRETRDRILLANRNLADQFVQSLDLTEKDVVLETYAGVGQVTRSLLAGGDPASLKKEFDSWKSLETTSNTKSSSLKAIAKSGRTATDRFPCWELDQDILEGHGAAIEEDPCRYPRPALVIANEPSSELCVRGLGLDRSTIITRDDLYKRHPESTTSTRISSHEPPVHIQKSIHAPNLLISHSSPYVWPTMTSLLSHDLVTRHLPVDQTIPSTKRPWKADVPPITVVSQFPDGVIGEQLFSQWVSTVVGGKSWIWEWGRIRLALLVGKGIYDRIMAHPGDHAYCKLTIMANALFDIKPLPPYHTPPRVISPAMRKKTIHVEIPFHKDTITYPRDFYPIPTGTASKPTIPLPRPSLQGLLLTPKVDPLIQAKQRDAWDYVLRKCFARPNSSLMEGLAVLAFGGENLVDKIEGRELDLDGKTFGGVDVDRKTKIRELKSLEWHRVVDVFDKWAFRPENLILERLTTDEGAREIGQD